MIKKYRKQFIIVAMCSVAAVLFLILGAINLVNYIETNKRSNKILQLLCENDGEFPSLFAPEKVWSNSFGGITDETPFEARYFTAIVDDKENIKALNMKKIAAITPEEACDYIVKARDLERNSGRLDNYKYKICNKGEFDLYIFLDCGKDINTANMFLAASVLIGVIGLIGVFLLILVFSKTVLKPIEANYDKQKAFITNASHDIKTPLTVINAEVDLLNLDYGKNEYTDEIKKQVSVLSDLTDKLVFLSKAEEIKNYPFSEFDLSKTLENAVLRYLGAAKANNLDIIREIQRDVYIKANEDLISTAADLLLDNAVKYAKNGGEIIVTLSKQFRQCRICVSNDIENLEVGNHDELFERFYRGDKSRNGVQNGNGIGLSVVKAIADTHKGTVSAEVTDKNTIIFTLTLSAL